MIETTSRHFIELNYEAYTAEEHATWRKLYSRMLPEWERYANPRFLEGIATLHLDPARLPKLADVNRFLSPRTGFSAHAVAGYVPAFEFFDCLRNRQFPTTVTVRPAGQLDYLPEPDIFHDIAGHVPMHTDAAFAETLVRFGACAHAAAARAAGIRDNAERTRVLASVIRAMARFFWFTVEFGLMRTPGGMKAYGSGLLSSHSELEHSIESPEVQRFPLQLEWVVNQSFEIDHFQPLLFWVESFDHLFEEVGRLEQWMRDGRLDRVAPCEPVVNERDLESFLPGEWEGKAPIIGHQSAASSWSQNCRCPKLGTAVEVVDEYREGTTDYRHTDAAGVDGEGARVSAAGGKSTWPQSRQNGPPQPVVSPQSGLPGLVARIKFGGPPGLPAAADFPVESRCDANR